MRRVWTGLRRRPSFELVLGVLLSATVALAVAIVLLNVVPPWVASTKGLTGTDRAEEIGRARTAFLAILAGVVAIIGAVFTGLSYRLNRAGQITERFTRAIDQLGNAELDVRLGGSAPARVRASTRRRCSAANDRLLRCRGSRSRWRG